MTVFVVIYILIAVAIGVVLIYTQLPGTPLDEAIIGVVSLLWPVLVAGLLVSAVSKGIAIVVLDRLILLFRRDGSAVAPAATEIE